MYHLGTTFAIFGCLSEFFFSLTQFVRTVLLVAGLVIFCARLLSEARGGVGESRAWPFSHEEAWEGSACGEVSGAKGPTSFYSFKVSEKSEETLAHRQTRHESMVPQIFGFESGTLLQKQKLQTCCQ